MRKLLGLSACLCLVFVYVSFSYLDRIYKVHGESRSIGLLLDSPGCRIPDLDPYDPLVASMLWRRPPLVCRANRPPLVRVRDNLALLEVIEGSLKAYGVKDRAKLRCCYRQLWREDDDEAEVDKIDNSVRYSNTCIPFSRDEAAVEVEFVRVECRNGGKKIYVDFFAFTPLKTLVEERCTARDADLQLQDSLSVLILGIDSVSRINFHRQMPLTDNWLQAMGAIEMLGYNKIGDNTYPNLLAMLSGRTIQETQDSCWSRESHTFDECQFLWRNFSRAGFRTAFAEDDAVIGTFNYNSRHGFLRQPTDYYLRPFHVTYNRVKGSKGEDHDGKLCLQSKANVDVLLDYASSFVRSMNPRRYFGLFWQSTVTHDNLNDAQQLDERLSSTLRNLGNDDLFNNTLLVVMSDHGLRFGEIRTTFHGWLEERLPLLTFMFPPWFRRKYQVAVANLELNAKRLTTPFDLHRTLADLVDTTRLRDVEIRRRSVEAGPARGRSLLLPVSELRTCADAGIQVHWCTCQQDLVVDVNSTEITFAARFVVDEINHLLKPYVKCASLEVKEVVSARKRFIAGADGSVPALVDFVLIVEVNPSGALFEATVRRSATRWEFANGKSLDVSRVNVYGTQSWCVADSQAKLFCYCLMAPKGL